MTLAKDTKIAVDNNGILCDVEISPCCWMYAGYPFQISYTAKDGSCWGIVKKDGLTFTDATEDDMAAMLRTLPVDKCHTCGKPHVYEADSNRGHQCEQCWGKEWAANFAKLQAEEAAQLAAQDGAKLREGYTHRTTIWIHPTQGGDDYQIDMYSKGEPSKREINATFRTRPSHIKDDYTITPLCVVSEATN